MPVPPRRPDEQVLESPIRDRAEADRTAARYARKLTQKGLTRNWGVRVAPATATSSLWAVVIGPRK